VAKKIKEQQADEENGNIFIMKDVVLESEKEKTQEGKEKKQTEDYR